jgi:hypothetical protein
MVPSFMRRWLVAALIAVIVAASLVLFIERSSPTTLGQRVMRSSQLEHAPTDLAARAAGPVATTVPVRVQLRAATEGSVVTIAPLTSAKRARRLMVALQPLPLLLAAVAVVLRGVAIHRPWRRLSTVPLALRWREPLGAPVGRRGPPPHLLPA